MCGIAGFVGNDSPDSLARMTQVIGHRGPDDHGTYMSRPLPDGTRAGLGSRRLAIIDLSPAGHMPMSTADGRLHIVYNGEVYNAPELRRELEGLGYRFRSRTDTEVVLYLFHRYGADCLRRLNGMFALAIWDEAARELVLARDHFGIKPLYYLQDGRRFAFASEIKSILQLPGVARRIRLDALNQYLTFLWVPDPATLFDGIQKLEAGHFAVLRDGHLSVEQYWDLSFPPAGLPESRDADGLAAELRARLTRSVRSQLISDVPLGAFLSAGLDSSAIVAAMAGSGGPLLTYTIGFPAKYRIGEVTLDDTNVAARTARYFGANHKEIIVEPNVVDLLPRLVWHMDEPVADPAVITAYLVCREARRTVTVLLSGVGGDELFAGYRKHRAHDLARRYQRLPAWLRDGIVAPAVGALPSFRGSRLKGPVRLAKKMVRSASLPPEERFLTDGTYLTSEQRRALLVPEVAAQVADADPWARHREWFARVRHADFLNQMLYLDTRTFMVSLNLTYTDKMSMASSVEVRVPFLDWELAEWAAQHVPPSMKLRGSKTKFLLREAMRPLLPAEVLTGAKAGFGAPVDYWLAHDLAPMVRDLLSPRCVEQRGLFNAAAVTSMIEEHVSGRRDWSLQLWQLLTLELWQRVFLDGLEAAPQLTEGAVLRDLSETAANEDYRVSEVGALAPATIGARAFPGLAAGRAPRVCFFAPVRDRALLDRVEFYRQDLDIVESLTTDLVVATRWREVPWNADLYVAWWWTWAFIPALKASVRRRPLAVIGVFNYSWPFDGADYLRRGWLERALIRFALGRARANVFASRLERDQVAMALTAPNPLHIPLAVDTDYYAPGDVERDSNLVLTIAWTNEGNAERKCIPEIIEAVPRILQACPRTRFVIAGERGSAYPRLARRVEELGVNAAVEFPGVLSRDDKLKLLQRCGVYLQPSLYEGFGLAILEAMSCGAAVVSSPAGAVTEVVGNAGVLVPGTDTAAIADATVALLVDSGRRANLGQLARNRAASLFPLARRHAALTSALTALMPSAPSGRK